MLVVTFHEIYSHSYKYCKKLKTPKSGILPSNLLKLRSLEQINKENVMRSLFYCSESEGNKNKLWSIKSKSKKKMKDRYQNYNIFRFVIVDKFSGIGPTKLQLLSILHHNSKSAHLELSVKS